MSVHREDTLPEIDRLVQKTPKTINTLETSDSDHILEFSAKVFADSTETTIFCRRLISHRRLML